MTQDKAIETSQYEYEIKRLMDDGPFWKHSDRKKRLQNLLNCMHTEPCKSPFDEYVIDFLELMLEYHDNAPAF